MWQLLDSLWLWSPESSLSILLKVLGAWSSPRGNCSHCWQLPQVHLSLCWHLHILTASARTEICSPLSLLKGWLLCLQPTQLSVQYSTPACIHSLLKPALPLTWCFTVWSKPTVAICSVSYRESLAYGGHFLVLPGIRFFHVFLYSFGHVSGIWEGNWNWKHGVSVSS